MGRSTDTGPLDALVKLGRAIPYHPLWNRLTGSLLASILLQQIYYYWKESGCRPFHKYTAPCKSSRPGDSWLEELGCSRRELEAARSAIGTKITTGDSRAAALKNNLVIYWTDSQHRTWYEINEPLLRRRLDQLHQLNQADDPDQCSGASDKVPSPTPIGPPPADSGQELAPDVQNVQQMTDVQSEQQLTDVQSEQQITDAHNAHPILMPAPANRCTEKNKKEKTSKDVGVGDVGVLDLPLDQDLLTDLALIGDADPQGLVSRYPPAQIRAWLDYCTSSDSAGLTNKPGFLRSRLSQGLTPPPAPRGSRPTAVARRGPSSAVDPPSSIDDPSPQPAPSPPIGRALRPQPHDPARAELERLWRTVLADLKLQMSAATFSCYLELTRPLQRVDDTLYVAVPNAYDRDWLDHRLRRPIDRTLAYVAPGLSVQFVDPSPVAPSRKLPNEPH
jgi:hypothetical protein